METQTLTELKRAMAVKLSLTSKGHKATIKADNPDEAVALAQKAHTMLLDLKARLAVPVDRTRSDYPVLILDAYRKCTVCNSNGEPCACCGGGMAERFYSLKHGGGLAAPWDPQAQKLADDWTVKIDLELNSKGIGWDVEVKAFPMEAGIALIEYTERRLATAFNPAETKGA